MTKLTPDFLSGYQALRRSLSRELGPDQAADVAQASFERAWRYAQANDVHSPRALLFEIARRIRIDFGRWRRGNSTQSLDEDIDSHISLHSILTPEQIANDRQVLDRLSQAIDGLPSRCREAFILHRVHGLTHTEVAFEMQVSAKCVEKHITNALRICRTIIDD